MSPVWGHAAGVFTVLLMAGFLGIWIWAWLPRHRRTFSELAHLPVEDLPMEDRPAQTNGALETPDTEPHR